MIPRHMEVRCRRWKLVCSWSRRSTSGTSPGCSPSRRNRSENDNNARSTMNCYVIFNIGCSSRQTVSPRQGRRQELKEGVFLLFFPPLSPQLVSFLPSPPLSFPSPGIPTPSLPFPPFPVPPLSLPLPSLLSFSSLFLRSRPP